MARAQSPAARAASASVCSIQPRRSTSPRATARSRAGAEHGRHLVRRGRHPPARPPSCGPLTSRPASPRTRARSPRASQSSSVARPASLRARARSRSNAHSASASPAARAAARARSAWSTHGPVSLVSPLWPRAPASRTRAASRSSPPPISASSRVAQLPGLHEPELLVEQAAQRLARLGEPGPPGCVAGAPRGARGLDRSRGTRGSASSVPPIGARARPRFVRRRLRSVGRSWRVMSAARRYRSAAAAPAPSASARSAARSSQAAASSAHAVAGEAGGHLGREGGGAGQRGREVLADGRREAVPVRPGRGLQPAGQADVEVGPLRAGEAGVPGIAQQGVAVGEAVAEEPVVERASHQGTPFELIDRLDRSRHAERIQRPEREPAAGHRSPTGGQPGRWRQVVQLRGIDGVDRRRQRDVAGRDGEPPGRSGRPPPSGATGVVGTRTPVPTHVRSSSSMNRQLPSERSTIRVTSSSGNASPTSSRTSVAASGAGSVGSSRTRRAVDGSSAAQAGAAWTNDGRAVATISRPAPPGAAVAASRKATRSGPAQWRSSTSHTWARSAARASSPSSHAANRAARSVSRPAPARRPSRHRRDRAARPPPQPREPRRGRPPRDGRAGRRRRLPDRPGRRRHAGPPRPAAAAGRTAHRLRGGGGCARRGEGAPGSRRARRTRQAGASCRRRAAPGRATARRPRRRARAGAPPASSASSAARPIVGARSEPIASSRDRCGRTPSDAERADGRGLALERQGRDRLDLDRLRHRERGRLAQQDAARLGRRLQPGRGVDRVPRDPPRVRPVHRVHDLARVDADAEPQVAAVQVEARAESLDRLDQGQAGPHGAFGIVVASAGHAVDGHGRVADELLQLPAMARRRCHAPWRSRRPGRSRRPRRPAAPRAT